jgi:ATP-dependent Clp protease adaptor protein ClpS
VGGIVPSTININMETPKMTQVGHITSERTKNVIEEPGHYKVIFVNDDVTPMEFVVDVLQKIFKHSQETAGSITLSVHNEGSAVVGVYSFEIAEQKGVETTVLARNNGFPLVVKIEKE